MMEGEHYAGGLELNFFSSAGFEAENPEDSTENAAIIARNAMRILMMGWNENWSDLASWQVFKAIFISRDPKLLRGMRLGFQQGFKHLFEQLKSRVLDSQHLNQAQLYLANCMSYLPFADLNPYESIEIPQWINGSWRMVSYKVTPIELTPTSGFRKLFINDDDRVFAYGLDPIVDCDAEPHLIFMGTTYPAGQGFHVQVNTDLEAFETPGKILYRHSRDKIAKWLDKQGKKVHVCGTSLGGSLSLLLAIDQGEKLSRVDALNPGGLYDPWRKSRFDHWDEIEEKPLVFIQKQGNDPVSKFGVWKKEWHLLHVIPPASLRQANGIIDHALNYAGLPETRFVGVDTEADNESRRTRNFWLYTVLRSLAYLGHEFYRCLVLPLVRYAASHKLALTAVGLFFLAAVFMPPGASTLFLIALSIPVGVYLAYKLYQAICILIGWNTVKEPPCHSPTLDRNKELDIYSNKIEEVFTYKEIGDYYYAKRCILKGKRFFPEEGSQAKFEVLEKSLQPQFAEEKLVVRTTKAKIYDMKQTVSLLDRFGFQLGAATSAKMEMHLAEQHKVYIMGKT